MYYGSGTVARSAAVHLADAAVYAPGGRCVCTHQMAVLFCIKWRHDIRIESVTSNRKSDSVDWCIFTWGTVRLE